MFTFNDSFMTIIKQCIKSGTIPMLLGEPGIGKSSWLEALATSMHTKCFTVACNQLADKADLTGARLVPAGETYKQVFYPHADIQDAIEYAVAHPRENPILFLDELNRTTPDVTSAALSIPTMRKIGSSALPSNLRIVIAGNDKGNVISLDEASVSRFVLFHVAPDVGTFFKVNPNINYFIKETLQKHPETLFCKTVAKSSDEDDSSDDDLLIEDIINDGDEMAQITTPRTISALSNWLNGFDIDTLASFLSDVHLRGDEEVSALQEIIEGHVGRTNFSIFLLSEIATGVMNHTTVAATTVEVYAPTCYDGMKACKTETELTEYIDTMSDRDISGSLLYALHEPVDNNRYIDQLARRIKRLEREDITMLMKLKTNDMLDESNVDALVSTGTDLSRSLSIILGA